MAELVGSEHVLNDPASRDYYSRDLSYTPGARAALVVSPGSVEELRRVAATATAAAYALVPRGGGMSYTRGYSPDSARSIIIDTRRLDRIVEINAADMYVTVECGCTWKSLYEALRERNLRTPHYGPLSGMFATVGGALSQNSLFLGSGDNGTAADSLLGLEIVLPDGTLLRTGSWAHRDGNPFFRHFGPDLSGIFTGDTGAFGIKARATLRLLRRPAATLPMSFAFPTARDMLATQIDLSPLQIAAECYGFDPAYNAAFEDSGVSVRQGLATLGGVVRSGPSFARGLGNALRLARSGRSALQGVPYSVHMTFEGHTAVIAREKRQLAHAICRRHSGVEIANSLPTALNAAPFNGLGSAIVGPDGEVWLPVHGFMPLSRVQAVGAAVERFLVENRERMQDYRIHTSYLTCFAGTGFIIEPSFYWDDEVQQLRLDRLSHGKRARCAARRAQPDTRAVALDLRDQLRRLMDEHGCCHLQIGRYYPYREMIGNEGLRDLLDRIKEDLDPEGLVNPGSLGLPG